MGNHEQKIVKCADDVALTAENQDSLQRLLFQLNAMCKKFNMKIFTVK